MLCYIRAKYYGYTTGRYNSEQGLSSSSTFGVWTSVATMVEKLDLKSPATSTEKFEREHAHCCKLVVWTEAEAKEKEEELTWRGDVLEQKDM